jgi:hypothetical protein
LVPASLSFRGIADAFHPFQVHDEALEMLQEGETEMAKEHALRSAIRDSPDPDPAREHFAKAVERYGQVRR